MDVRQVLIQIKVGLKVLRIPLSIGFLLRLEKLFSANDLRL